MSVLTAPARVTPVAQVQPDPERECPLLSLREVDPLRETGWNELVMSHPDYSFFCGSAWASVLKATYGYVPHYFAVSDGKRLLAMLPVMEARSWLTGTRGVALPFTDECPPLTSNAVSCQDLLAELSRYGQSRGWNYWECRGAKGLPVDMPAARTYYGHMLDLTPGEETLFDRFKPTVRTAIRKAEQAGVLVETSRSWDALRTFYALHCRTRRRHGVPPQPLRFFRNLHQEVLSRNLGMVVVARCRQAPIAAAVFLHLGQKAIYKYGASHEAAQDLRGNNLVMWRAIQWYARAGCRFLHLGRTAVQADGLRRFKLAWGAREHSITYLKFDCRTRTFVAGEAEAFGFKNRVLARLPIWVLRAIGSSLYRHMA